MQSLIMHSYTSLYVGQSATNLHAYVHVCASYIAFTNPMYASCTERSLIVCVCSYTGRSLIYVFLYGVIIIYIYAQVGFAVYREIYIDASGHFCRTMYECMVTSIHRGLLTGLYDVSCDVVPFWGWRPIYM